jgi:hypothetical protein
MHECRNPYSDYRLCTTIRLFTELVRSTVLADEPLPQLDQSGSNIFEDVKLAKGTT